MLFVFFGPSCTGKSTIAARLVDFLPIEVYSGRDYLRLATNEAEAWRHFLGLLNQAAANQSLSGPNICYLVTEPEQLAKVESIPGAVKVKFNASLDTIKERFSQRTKRRLAPQVEQMLERQYAQWQNVTGDYRIDTTREPKDVDVVEAILNKLRSQ